MLETNPAVTLSESPELIQKAIETFIAEYYHYAEVDLDDPNITNAFGEEFVQEIKAIRIPQKKWRKEIWRRLLETAFDSPKEKEAKAQSKLAHGGFAFGQISIGLGILAATASEDEDIKNLFELGDDDIEAMKNAKGQLGQAFASIDSEEGDQINEGFHAALKENRDGKRWSNATDATLRHELMLLLGDQLENMRSIDLMYDHLTAIMQENEKQDLGISRNSFKEFCSEIGLQGRRYKRLKSK